MAKLEIDLEKMLKPIVQEVIDRVETELRNQMPDWSTIGHKARMALYTHVTTLRAQNPHTEGKCPWLETEFGCYHCCSSCNYGTHTCHFCDDSLTHLDHNYSDFTPHPCYQDVTPNG